MKTMTFNPPLGKDVAHGYSIQVEAAHPKSNGTVVMETQLWNEDVHLLAAVNPAEKAERHAFVVDAQAIESALDSGVLDKALVQVGVDVLARLRKATGKKAAKEEEPRRQQSLCAPGMVCAAVDDEGARVYVLRGDDGTLHVAPSVVGPFNGEVVTHVPPATLPWPLPRARAILRRFGEAQQDGWTATLLATIEAWLRKASDLGSASAYLLLALHVMAGYVIEQLDYLAIVELVADAERGKSRTGHAWACVSRHGMALVGIREATLLRAATDKQAALFIDLTDLWETAKRAGCEDILLARWERGGYVERVKYPDRGAFEDIQTYFVFGPTLLASNQRTSSIMETRVCGIDLPFSKRRFAGRIRPEDALPLVEQLMAWRAVMMGAALVECDPPAEGRLGDILRPLKQVVLTAAPERVSAFDELVTWQQRRRREDLSQTAEAAILRAIKERLSDVRQNAGVKHLQVSTILESFNSKQPSDEQCTAKWLGARVRAMSFKTQRVARDRRSSLIWDEELFTRLCAHYGISDEDDTSRPATGNAPHAPYAPHDAQAARESDERTEDAASQSSTHAPQSSAQSPVVEASQRGKVEGVEDAEHVDDCYEGGECENANMPEGEGTGTDPEQAPLWECVL